MNYLCLYEYLSLKSSLISFLSMRKQQEPQVTPGTSRITDNPRNRQELSILSFIYHVLFLVGSLLIVFAAFRNTLTW